MKKIFYLIRNGKGFSIHMDKGLLKGLLFFTLIVFLHDLVDKGDSGFAVPIVNWLYDFTKNIGIYLIAAYAAWMLLNGDPLIKVKKEIE